MSKYSGYGIIESYEKFAQEDCKCCLGRFCGWVEIRPKCMMSKCCSICNQVDTCKIVCTPLCHEFKIDVSDRE